MRVGHATIVRDRTGRLQHRPVAPHDRVASTAGGGLGAPVGARYVVIAPNDGMLTAERALGVSGLLTLLDNGANADVVIGLAATAIRPTIEDLTGATGVGPHALSGTPGALLVMVNNLTLREVGFSPSETEFTVSGGSITLGHSLLSSEPFVVWWWA